MRYILSDDKKRKLCRCIREGNAKRANDYKSLTLDDNVLRELGWEPVPFVESPTATAESTPEQKPQPIKYFIKGDLSLAEDVNEPYLFEGTSKECDIFITGYNAGIVSATMKNNKADDINKVVDAPNLNIPDKPKRGRKAGTKVKPKLVNA
jgi:hypothetical protein